MEVARNSHRNKNEIDPCPALVVGDEFRGGIVAKVDETIVDVGNAIRIKRIVTMKDTGIMIVMSHVKEKQPEIKPKVTSYFSSKNRRNDNVDGGGGEEEEEKSASDNGNRSSTRSMNRTKQTDEANTIQRYGGDSSDIVKEYEKESTENIIDTSSPSITAKHPEETTTNQRCSGDSPHDVKGYWEKNPKREVDTSRSGIHQKSFTSLTTTDSSTHLSSEEENMNKKRSAGQVGKHRSYSRFSHLQESKPNKIGKNNISNHVSSGDNGKNQVDAEGSGKASSSRSANLQVSKPNKIYEKHLKNSLSSEEGEASCRSSRSKQAAKNTTKTKKQRYDSLSSAAGDVEGEAPCRSSRSQTSLKNTTDTKKQRYDSLSSVAGDDEGELKRNASTCSSKSQASLKRTHSNTKKRVHKQDSQSCAGSIASYRSESGGSIKSKSSSSRSSRHRQRRRQNRNRRKANGVDGNTSDHSSSSNSSAEAGNPHNRRRRRPRKKQQSKFKLDKTSRFASSIDSASSSKNSKDSLMVRPKRHNSMERYQEKETPPAMQPAKISEPVEVGLGTPSKLLELEQSLLRQNYHFVEDPNFVDDDSVPLSILVYDQHDLPPKMPGSYRGVWVFDDDTSSISTYGRQAVFLHQPTNYSSGSESLTLTADENDEHTGLWGYREGEEPSDGESWYPRGDALVVPPTANAPDSFVPAGKYTFALSTPTRSQRDVRTKLRESLKMTDSPIPEVFKQNGNKLPVKVVPKSKIPKTHTVEKGSLPVAQWAAYYDGLVNAKNEAGHFVSKPSNVDLYIGKSRPPGSATDGLWGCYNDCQLDVDHPELWDPGNVLIFPPGMDPGPDIRVHGSWKYSDTTYDIDGREGPRRSKSVPLPSPTKSTEARRLSKIQIPDIFGSATDVPSLFQSPPKTSGRKSSSNSNNPGTPSRTPRKSFSTGNHPGTPKHTPRLSNVGRLRIPDTFDHHDRSPSTINLPQRKTKLQSEGTELDSVPLSILVFSHNAPDLPPRMPGRNRGIWVYGDEEEFEHTASWKSQEVLLHRPGVASLVSIDDISSRQSGIWGYPVGEAPTDDESWHPKGEALVVPPNTQAPTRFIPAGMYTYAYDDDRFPPPFVQTAPDERGDDERQQRVPGKLDMHERYLPPQIHSPTRVPRKLDSYQLYSPHLMESPSRRHPDPGKLEVEELFPPPLIQSPNGRQRDPGRLKIPKCFSNY